MKILSSISLVILLLLSASCCYSQVKLNSAQVFEIIGDDANVAEYAIDIVANSPEAIQELTVKILSIQGEILQDYTISAVESDDRLYLKYKDYKFPVGTSKISLSLPTIHPQTDYDGLGKAEEPEVTNSSSHMLIEGRCKDGSLLNSILIRLL